MWHFLLNLATTNSHIGIFLRFLCGVIKYRDVNFQYVFLAGIRIELLVTFATFFMPQI